MARALLVALVLLTCGTLYLFVAKIWWMPALISTSGAAIDREFSISLAILAVVFFFAQIGLGFFVWTICSHCCRCNASLLWRHSLPSQRRFSSCSSCSGACGRGKLAETNPWEATTLEWGTQNKQIQVIRGPYEFSVPGAKADFLMQREAQEAS